MSLNNIDTQTYWNKTRKYFTIVIFIVLAIFISINFDLEGLKNFLQDNEETGFVICFILYGVLGLTLIPSEPITILILTWKGPWIAFLMATLGNTLAALIEFVIGGNIGDVADFEKKKEKLPFNLGKLSIDSPVLLILARMLPGYGPKFISLVCGVYQVPLLTYLWTTVVANSIGAAFIAIGGMGVLKSLGIN